MLRNPLRATLTLGMAAYLLLLALALLFYAERTVFADIAFHSVMLLKTKALFVQNGRFVAAFTQAFPLAAQGLHFSLKGVLMAYSSSFVVLPAASFLACVAWLKDWKMGLVMLLLSTLMVKDSFYWIQSELPQGMAFLVLVLALVRRSSTEDGFDKSWVLGLVFLLWVVVAFAHPMLAFATFFALVFFLEKSSEPSPKLQKTLLASAVFMLGFLIIKNKLLGTAEYDAEAMSRVKNLKTLFPHYFEIGSNLDFLRWCVTDYWLLTLSFIGVNVVYFRQKNWRKGLFFNASFFGYLLLVNVSIPDGYHQFYMENLYLPLAFMTILPLVFDVFPIFEKEGKYSKWALSALALCLALRVASIGLAHQPWTKRLQWESKLMAENPGKLLLQETPEQMKVLLMSWGSSFEFMLLSSLENPKDTRLITIDEDPSRLSWATNKPRSVITEWYVWDFDELPHRYFNPQDTSLYVTRLAQ